LAANHRPIQHGIVSQTVGLISESHTDLFSWHTSMNFIRGDVLCHNGASPDNRSSPYADARDDNGSVPDPGIVF
jgi:hypothetical protein